MRRRSREWDTEYWILLGGIMVLAIAGVIAYLSLANQISSDRDEISEARSDIRTAASGIVEHDTQLEGMGEELKGLSSNLEHIEVVCHQVARHTPETEGHPAKAFAHYQYCMSHHGWQPVGWKG